MSIEAEEREGVVMGAEPKARKGAAQAPLDPAALREAGLAYVARYAASGAMLRRTLSRKAARAAGPDGDPDLRRAAVEQAMAGLSALGVIDDAAFARGRAASLFRRGAGPRAISAALAQRGVDAETIEGAIETLRDDAPDEDLAFLAAIRLARRRRLGPWRAERRADKRAADLAALARGGTPFDAALRVIDGDAAPLEAALTASADLQG